MKQELQQLYKLNKYNEMIEYLKQDNEYWLKNDIWKLDKLVKIKKENKKKFTQNIIFNDLKIEIKTELKYIILYNFKNYYTNCYDLENRICPLIKRVAKYISRIQPTIKTFVEIDESKFLLYLINVEEISISLAKSYIGKLKELKRLFKDLTDDREETEKDIWDFRKIIGVRIPANDRRGFSINFNVYPKYYRECMKKYFRTIVTKKSVSQCINIHVALNVFFQVFYEMNYQDGFLKSLCRDDIEKYILKLKGKYKDKNVTYVNKFLSYPRTFLEYIQLANYDEAPEKEVSFLIFQDDIPKREKDSDRLQRVKFVPEPILKQLDNNIMELDRPEVLPIYILLRETGWRGIDILNLRYNNCLEKIWNSKEQEYNYYLCGEITKTGIASLKIPIREKVAQMVLECINNAKEKSTENNNPEKYLFNVYDGKRKGRPIHKDKLLGSIKRLITEKDIRDENGNLFHFRTHSLRHTRAKEYVEQGISISIIQQILGHRSLQMTIHYATVTENTLYEQWKNTEDLNLFKIDENNKKQKISTKESENLVRYEYVRKNLDAVKVPFGVCFKPSKLPCKQQINQCLTCASFCTTDENLQEYNEEIARVEEQIKISEECGRTLWKEKNEEYLK